MFRALRRIFCWRTVAAILAICLVSIAPVSSYVPVPIPTDKASIVHELGDDPVVFVTLTGAAYHLAGCRHLARSAVPIRLSEAAQRYRPCTSCRPPFLE